MRQRSKRLWAVRKDQRAQCTHLIEQAELQALPGDGARADEHSSSPATCCARDTVATTPSITGGGGVDDADVEVLDEQDDAGSASPSVRRTCLLRQAIERGHAQGLLKTAERDALTEAVETCM
jgi:hypothetical protein